MDIWPTLLQIIQCVTLLTISFILDKHFFSWNLRASDCWGFFEKLRREISSVVWDEGNILALSEIQNTKSDLHYFKRWIKTDQYEQIKWQKAFNCTNVPHHIAIPCWNTGNCCRAESGAQSQPAGPPYFWGVVIISFTIIPQNLLLSIIWVILKAQSKDT